MALSRRLLRTRKFVGRRRRRFARVLRNEKMAAATVNGFERFENRRCDLWGTRTRSTRQRTEIIRAVTKDRRVLFYTYVFVVV